MSATAFPDHFSRDAQSYAQFRPRYPAALFAWLAGLPARRRVALDCATGNGQAATMLAFHFPRVLGVDASRNQLRAATRAPGVDYAAALGEALPLRAGSVDLLCVAQALHWLDLPRFTGEAYRVAAPGAALAVWAYGRLTSDPAITTLIDHFHDETVGPYWSTARRLVEEGYRSLPLPIDELAPPALAIEAELRLPDLLGYLRTWSAVGAFQKALGRDPVTQLAPALAACWGEPGRARRIVWPLYVRAGRLSPPGRTSP